MSKNKKKRVLIDDVKQGQTIWWKRKKLTVKNKSCSDGIECVRYNENVSLPNPQRCKKSRKPWQTSTSMKYQKKKDPNPNIVVLCRGTEVHVQK